MAGDYSTKTTQNESSEKLSSRNSTPSTLLHAVGSDLIIKPHILHAIKSYASTGEHYYDYLSSYFNGQPGIMNTLSFLTLL